MLDIDKTTLGDLSIFNSEEQFSVFHLLNLTVTSNGKDQLNRMLHLPFDHLNEISGVQETLKQIMERLPRWPELISNGTIKVIERFYDTPVDPPPAEPNGLSTLAYRLLHGPDYSLVKYSAIHCFDFIRGMKLICELFDPEHCPGPLKDTLAECRKTLSQSELGLIQPYRRAADMPGPELMQFARFIRFRFKQGMFSLLHLHARIDAWCAMAKSIKKYQLVFPAFHNDGPPFIEAKGLYHLLLAEPVSYDISLQPEKNFMFLTGANMAGKSTFIKSVGIAAFLAHTGMGVPAKSMSLTVFNGILSNINVSDNIARGESYFFNEVQRIRSTITKINDGRRWLILIDELFKGTNVQDAMKCSSIVIEGLLKIRQAVFILSTHLYEIATPLEVHSNIRFCYFETRAEEEQLKFSYQLREGVSNDRFGYLILKREGVVEMLNKLG